MSRERNVLLVFAKEPSPGKAKTRLAAALGAERAAELASAFLDDTLVHASEAAASARASLLLVHDPPGDAARGALSDRVGRLGILGTTLRSITMWPQLADSDLAVRLERAFAAALASYECAVAIGTDSPDVSPRDYVRAFGALERSSAVLGPARDGGYWLVGLSRPGLEGAFRDEIAWSTSRALADTKAAFERRGVLPVLLEEREDVDDADSLALLAARLREDPSRAPRTAKLLRGS